jgi:protein-S-isoprenylcysteine O-methyltransferase Ste14
MAGMWLFLKNLIFTVLVPGTIAFYVPVILADSRRSPGSSFGYWHGWVALVPLVIGSSIYLRCVWDFATIGRGTPAPIDAPKRLVVAGLYRYVRNPMYVGVLLVVLGWAVFFWSRSILLYAGIVTVGFHTFVVLFEEPILSQRFGNSYDAYRRSVHRWIPGRPYNSA